MSSEIGTTAIVLAAVLTNTGDASLTYNTAVGQDTVESGGKRYLDSLGQGTPIVVRAGGTTIATILYSTARPGTFRIDSGAPVPNATFEVTVTLAAQ